MGRSWRRAAAIASLAWMVPACSSETSSSSAVTSSDGGDAMQLPPVLDGGGSVPDSPDGTSACPAGICNYQTGEGCPTANACLPGPTDAGDLAPTCYPAGTAGSGEACAQYTDCMPGLDCAGGVCRKLCCGGDWSVCAPDQRCLSELAVTLGGVDVPAHVAVCVPVNQCNALVPGTCPQGTGCFVIDATGATACAVAGTGGPGAACPCKEGFTCVTGACRRLCTAVEGGGEPSCPVGEGRCIHFNKDPSGVGECTPS